MSIAAIPASGAAAQSLEQPDGVAVGLKGQRVAHGFSRALGVFVQAPAGWHRGCCYTGHSGEWDGPVWRPSLKQSHIAPAHIDWSVTFTRGKRSLASVARHAEVAGFPETDALKRSIPHIVGGRKVGKLKAFAVVDSEPAPGARREASIAIGLSRKVTAAATFFTADPPADNVGVDGSVTMDGKPASQWNREQVDAALAGVYVEGNLPPRRVTAKAHGKAIKGKVSDAFADPLATVKVTLQRAAGKRWRTVRKGTTNKRGAYSLKTRGPGRYRVVTTLNGARAKSRPVRR